MSTFQYLMLGLGVFYAVAAPIALMRAIRRRKWLRLFELVTTMLFMSGFFLTILSPAVIQNAWAALPPLRWLYPVSAVLMLINFLGISRWLFNRHQKARTI